MTYPIQHAAPHGVVDWLVLVFLTIGGDSTPQFGHATADSPGLQSSTAKTPYAFKDSLYKLPKKVFV